jgi:hypothetical protein
MRHAMSVFCLADSTARAHKKALFGNKGSRAIGGALKAAPRGARGGTPGKPGLRRFTPQMRQNSHAKKNEKKP